MLYYRRAPPLRWRKRLQCHTSHTTKDSYGIRSQTKQKKWQPAPHCIFVLLQLYMCAPAIYVCVSSCSYICVCPPAAVYVSSCYMCVFLQLYICVLLLYMYVCLPAATYMCVISSISQLPARLLHSLDFGQKRRVASLS
jgi:hypothetical protein